ncbi:CaiB/BaiF CoA transferase family protein [Sphingomonas floccifaciens]|uniref:CaiB/BaiF CoA transferase family protein n=1 Tax=Sphingomonas floccifaciens TaxID=1844115 RepID=A0ABW4NHH3_9SPHN
MTHLPLAGLTVVEMAGIGPAPYGGLLLQQMGAHVTRIDRVTSSGLGIEIPERFDLLNRGKTTVALDLKSATGQAEAKRLIDAADVVIEGFRPGVMESLGLCPAAFALSNPKLVYGRVTGWGQDGPLAKAAGHDLNYIAITGALDAIGEADGPPVVPLNLVGDFAGGTLFLIAGVLAAVLAARESGRGRVVDASIVDGVTNLLTLQHALHAMGEMSTRRGDNLIDGGAPFYAVYRTADDLWVSIAAVEPKFYAELIGHMGLSSADLPKQYDRSRWNDLRTIFADAFRTRTRQQWCEVLEGTDSCFAPVLDIHEAKLHPQIAYRSVLTDAAGVTIPSPAPRFASLAPESSR